LHRRCRHRCFGQPVGAAKLLAQVDQDRVRIGHDRFAIDQHRDLAERIQPQEFGRFVRAGHQIHFDQFRRLAEQGQEQLCAVGVAGKRVHIEFHGRDVLGCDGSAPRQMPGSHQI
jgi:hypothetical protein